MANTLQLGNGKWATGKDTVLAFNDTNNNFKPLPFDFSRASSATVVNQSGLIETVGSGEPRIDFQGNTKGALLLEPSRTNLVPYSQTFTGWSLTNALETPNALISPDGKLNASKFVTNNTGVDIKYINIPVVQNTTYTYSFYCNYVGGLGLQGRFYDNTNGANIEYYDYMNQLEAGKWKRVTRTFTTPTGCSNIQVWYLASSSSQPVTAYYWGAQLEVGSYATSYIPTSGQSGGVTRVADTCSQTTPDGVIGQTEGTMYAEIDFKSKPEAGSPISGIMSLNNNVNNLQNTIILGIERQSGGTNRFYPFVQVGNSTVAYIIGQTLTDGVYKVAFAYKQNDFILYVNGVQIGTDNSGAVPTTSQVLVGERYNSDTIKFSDGIKETKLYNTRLSNSELAALTS